MNLDKFSLERTTQMSKPRFAVSQHFMTYILAVNGLLAEQEWITERSYSDSSGSVHRCVMYGNLCKLSICTGAGNGTECVLAYTVVLRWCPGRSRWQQYW